MERLEQAIAALGRGVVVRPGAPAPGGWADAPRITVDGEALAGRGGAIEALHLAWVTRRPVVVELAAGAAELQVEERHDGAPHELDPSFSFPRERLGFLVWANTYDGRGSGGLRWWWAAKAARAFGGEPTGEVGDGDLVLPDGTAVLVDGGPREPLAGLPHPVVHRESVNVAERIVYVSGAARPSARLAPDQMEAVAHRRGPARVIAPAGSGKTRVLTERLRHLVRDRKVERSLVTALAYNNRAAAEMRARAGDVGPQIRTLHAYGRRLVGRAAAEHGRPAPRALDEREVRRVLDGLVDVRPKANTDRLGPYLEALAEVRLGLWSPGVVERRRDDVPGFARVFSEYRDRLDRLGAVDFDEMIYGAVEALLRSPGVRRLAQRECTHLLVDEFQDLTPAYLLLVRLLAAPEYQVFGVGDDDQVVYGYAGADPAYLVDYDTYFPGAAAHALEVNYRCPRRVVEAAATLLTHNRRRVEKVITPRPDAVDGPEGLEVRVLTTVPADRGDDDGAGAAIVAEARRLLGGGARPRELAVLARVNVTLLEAQIALDAAGIPCNHPLNTDLLLRTGVAAALAYLRLATAAAGALSGRDLEQAIRRPPRRLGKALAHRFRRKRSWSLADLETAASGLDGQARRSADKLVADLRALSELARAGASTADLLFELRERVGLGTALERLDATRRSDAPGHGDDLAALIAVAPRHPGPATFEGWLREQLARPGAGDGVTLSSVHRVKGLEWPYVVVVGADAGLFPHRLAQDVEEERRVFHVAITRASARCLVLAQGTPSPFLEELRVTAVERRERDAKEREAKAGKTGPTRRPGPATDRAGTEPADVASDGLLEALKDWRRQRAAADGVPPYVVAHNRHLEAVARVRPAAPHELARCEGWGETRIARYGDDLLALVTGYCSYGG